MVGSVAPILAMAPHPWSGHWLSRQHLLSRLGQRGWPILYSHGPLSVWDRNTPRWREAPWWGDSATSDGVMVDRAGRLPPRWPRWPWWDHTARRLHAERLRRLLPHWDRNGILVLFHPMFWPYAEWLQPRRVLYHVYDVHHAMDHWSPELEQMEQALATRADLITAASEGMIRALPDPGPAKARLLYNGADVESFAIPPPPCPPDLAAIPPPRIGYVGRINAKVDFAAITHVARARPDWHWVLLGQEVMEGARAWEREAREAWHACLRLPNLHYLGIKPRHAVPAYTHHMNVNTICYRIRPDDWVVHGYPVKLHEYLATGLPVVAGAQDAVKRLFAHVVEVAHTPEEWLDALDRAIHHHGAGSPELRRQVAMQNDWDQRVTQWETWIRATL